MLEARIASLRDLVQMHQELAVVAAFLICFGESLAIISLALPLFSAMLTLGAMLSNAGSWPLMAGWASSTLGAVAGYWVSYLFGYHYNHRIEALIKTPRYKVLFENAEHSFKRWGIWAVLIGRFFKPSRTVVALAAGMSRLPILQFQFANILSAIGWTAFMLFAGASLTALHRLLF